jgi:hypothetical protein
MSAAKQTADRPGPVELEPVVSYAVKPFEWVALRVLLYLVFAYCVLVFVVASIAAENPTAHPIPAYIPGAIAVIALAGLACSARREPVVRTVRPRGAKR